MVERSPARVARRSRPGTNQTGRRPHSENHLWREWTAHHSRADPGLVRYFARTYRRPRPHPASDPGFGPKPSSDPDHHRFGNFLARELSEDQEGAPAQVSQACLAVTPLPAPD